MVWRDQGGGCYLDSIDKCKASSNNSNSRATGKIERTHCAFYVQGDIWSILHTLMHFISPYEAILLLSPFYKCRHWGTRTCQDDTAGKWQSWNPNARGLTAEWKHAHGSYRMPDTPSGIPQMVTQCSPPPYHTGANQLKIYRYSGKKIHNLKTTLWSQTYEKSHKIQQLVLRALKRETEMPGQLIFMLHEM